MPLGTDPKFSYTLELTDGGLNFVRMPVSPRSDVINQETQVTRTLVLGEMKF